MNKNNIAFRVWEIAYPIGIYFVVANIAMFLAQILLGAETEQYMTCQIVASCFTIPFVYRFYRQDQIMMGILKPEPWITKEHLTNVLWVIVIAALVGIGLNNLIQMTPLVTMSKNYEEMSGAFYASSLPLELLGSALVTPLLEELLYRGIVYGRMRRQVGMIPAVLLSALIFGVVHFNIVQFLYAFLLGIVLALCMERCNHMYGAVAAHMTANAIAVIRTETGWLWNTAKWSVGAAVFSVLCLAAGIVLLVRFLKKD